MPRVLTRNPALRSPRLLDCFTVTRRRQIMDDKGYSTVPNPEKSYQVNGVVTIASPNDLERLSDGQYAGKTINVVTQFRLRTACQVDGEDFQPDIVTWAGSDFLVASVDDYSRYGPGFVEALATSMVNLDPPPGELA
jgi:galactose-6-phosphate isomerase